MSAVASQPGGLHPTPIGLDDLEAFLPTAGHDVPGGHNIIVGPPGRSSGSLTIRFDRVAELAVESWTPIRSLVATEWLDTDAPPDKIKAPWLRSLYIRSARVGASRHSVLFAGAEVTRDQDGAGVSAMVCRTSRTRRPTWPWTRTRERGLTASGS